MEHGSLSVSKKAVSFRGREAAVGIRALKSCCFSEI